MKRLKITAPKADLGLLAITLVLTGFGLAMVYDASVVAATRDYGDGLYYVKSQAVWVAIGLVALLAAWKIPFRIYRQLALPIVLISIALLALVFIPGLGVTANGAARWISLGFGIFQPSEFAKLAVVIYLAALFENREALKGFRSGVVPLGAVLVVFGALLIKEPDMGTFMILSLSASLLYFAAGASLKWILAGIPVAAAAVAILAVVSGYRSDRIRTFLNPSADIQDTGYHLNQILLALGSGGLFGTGLGQSRGKYEYIPEVQTDSIFAVIGEELGFVGALAVVGAFGFLLYRAYQVIRAAPNRFGELLAIGITLNLAIQIVVNLGSIVALLPLTGVPLPLISYGGSNLVVTMLSVGILLNISSTRA